MPKLKSYLTVVIVNVLLNSCAYKKSSQKSFFIIPEANKSVINYNVSDKKVDEVEVTAQNKLFNETNFCYLACPKYQSSLTHAILLNHKDFVLSYNTKTKFADWVAYKVNPEATSTTNRSRNWKTDPKLPLSVAMTPQDYKGAYDSCGYDRGHQAPLADFKDNSNWQATNYLSNITPQKAPLNRGAWYQLEHSIRDLSRKRSDSKVYVITGPYHSNIPMCMLPNAKLSMTLPNGYWKVITLIENDKIYHAAFVFAQDTSKNSNYCHHLTSIDKVESLSNLRFVQSKTSYEASNLIKSLGCD